MQRIWLFLSLAVMADALEPVPMERAQAMAAFSAAHGGHALLIRQNGKTLLEAYTNGHTKREPHRIYSGTKAFWCLTAFAAEKDGLLKLDDHVADTITEWQNDKRRSKITVRQLLDFSSGMEPLFGLHENNYVDRTTSALKASLAGTTGQSFIYGPAALQVYHELLARKLREKKMTPTRYLERKVLSPLDLNPQRYLPDQRGAPLLASGFMQTAREWMELGNWLLKHPEMLAQLQTSDANHAYGFGFWNNHAAESRYAREVNVEELLDKKWHEQSWRHACISRAAPADMIACIGSYGQRLFIVPSQKLVIVRLAYDKKTQDAHMLRLFFQASEAGPKPD